MLSLKWMTLAYIIGILWGLYLELNTLIVTSIFLSLFLLMFVKKYKCSFIVLSLVCILGCLYTEFKLNDYNNIYADDSKLTLSVTIISQAEEKEYTYKYNCKNEDGDKFILYLKKSKAKDFQIGDKLNITGNFNLPDIARNTRSVLIIDYT